jgi:hypothetical protein
MSERLHFFDHFAAVEKMPNEVISEIVVNANMAVGPVSHNVRHWLDKDYVLEHAGYFALGGESGVAVRIQAPNMHRAFVLEAHSKGYFDEFGNAYSQVVGKGSGLSEYAAIKRSGEVLEIDRRAVLMKSREPNGLFGFDHAKQDMEVSDAFAAYGGRVSRALAILVLDHAKFRQWAESKLGRSSYPCLEMLDRVEGNGDTAAILVRLFATERMNEMRVPGIDGYFSRSGSMKRASGVLLAELSRRGTRGFLERFCLNEYRSFKTRTLIRRLQNTAGGVADHELLAFFAAYFDMWNRGVHKRVSADRYQGKLTVSLDTRNIDLIGNWYDFEQSVPDTSQYLEYNSYAGCTFPRSFDLENQRGLIYIRAFRQKERLEKT